MMNQQDQATTFCVCDTGIGLSTEELPKIFNRFWQAEPSRSRQSGGAGLGLAIAQSIVQAHHGQIKVSRRPRGGTCFTVELHQAAPPHHEPTD